MTKREGRFLKGKGKRGMRDRLPARHQNRLGKKVPAEFIIKIERFEESSSKQAMA
jgi:hypothetical protein